MPSIIADLYENKSLIEDYTKQGAFIFPMHDEVDPKVKKTEEYCVDICKAMFNLLMTNKTQLPASKYQYIQILRDYGTGNQNEDYYINLYRKGNVKTSQENSQAQGVAADTDGYWTKLSQAHREGLGGLDTSIVSVARHIMSALYGMFDSQQQDIFVNSVDSRAVKEEEDRMYEALFEAENQAVIQEMERMFGLPLMKNKKFPSNVTLEELEVYKDMGGFRGEWAGIIETLIKYAETSSDWKRYIGRKHVADMAHLNMISGKTVYDPVTGEDVEEYCDPANVMIEYHIKDGSQSSEFGGEFELVKLSKLVRLGFSKDELIRTAKMYTGMFGNIKDFRWEDSWTNEGLNEKLMYFNIPVFHCYWREIDVKKRLLQKNDYGRERVYDLDFDQEVEPLSEKRKEKGFTQEEMNTRKDMIYRCSWIVNTNKAYNYGPMVNQLKKSKKQSLLPIFLIRGQSTNEKLIFGSLTESIIPFLNNVQFAYLKYQDALMKSNPGGYQINLRLLQNLKVGGKKISELEAFEMFFWTGRLPFRDTPIGENYKGGGIDPIKKIEGNIGELLAVASNEIHFNLQMIRELTGLDKLALGLLPEKGQSATASKLSVAGASTILRPLFEDIFEAKRQLAYRISKRVPLLIKNDKKSKEAYTKILGERDVDILSNMVNDGTEYGMYLQARATQEEMADLMAAAQEALSPGRDGKIDINLSQYMYIFEQIKSGGNLKRLSRDLAFLIRRNNEEMDEKAKENIRAQTESQNAMKEAESARKLKENQQEADNNFRLQQLKGQQEIEQIREKGKTETKSSVVTEKPI
jgi:hypothetical protein